VSDTAVWDLWAAAGSKFLIYFLSSPPDVANLVLAFWSLGISEQ
jgi:hypothetical protein